MTPKKMHWITGLCCGSCVGAVTFALAYPYWLGPDAKIARRNGYPLFAYVDVMRINRDTRSQPLNAQQLKDLRDLVQNPNASVRTAALSTLFHARNSSLACSAAQLARTRLKDPDPLVRQYALSALYRLKASDVLAIATRIKKSKEPGKISDPIDQSEYVQSKADQIIAAFGTREMASRH